ncbi:hypothetical protein, partial [Aquaspirillum serpens]|uniref:hypothetical protein n=1 Tax=Aquaspirillum serpens TaxID=190 RepID=UPI00058F6ED7
NRVDQAFKVGFELGLNVAIEHRCLLRVGGWRRQRNHRSELRQGLHINKHSFLIKMLVYVANSMKFFT